MMDRELVIEMDYIQEKPARDFIFLKVDSSC